MNVNDPLFAPLAAAAHREIGGVQIDVAPAGGCRVKRIVYPVGTSLCMHAHVGLLARGRVHGGLGVDRPPVVTRLDRDHLAKRSGGSGCRKRIAIAVPA